MLQSIKIIVVLPDFMENHIILPQCISFYFSACLHYYGFLYSTQTESWQTFDSGIIWKIQAVNHSLLKLLLFLSNQIVKQVIQTYCTSYIKL